MTGADILILLVLAAAAGLAVRSLTKTKGSCCGDCSRCGGKCGK